MFLSAQPVARETAEQYIRVLYELAEHCEFRDKCDEHIRDRLIVGIKDKELSHRFKLKADLTLAEVIEQARQAEEITSRSIFSLTHKRLT